jgi:hypothetical protein
VNGCVVDTANFDSVWHEERITAIAVMIIEFVLFILVWFGLILMRSGAMEQGGEKMFGFAEVLSNINHYFLL